MSWTKRPTKLSCIVLDRSCWISGKQSPSMMRFQHPCECALSRAWRQALASSTMAPLYPWECFEPASNTLPSWSRRTKPQPATVSLMEPPSKSSKTQPWVGSKMLGEQSRVGSHPHKETCDSYAPRR